MTGEPGPEPGTYALVLRCSRRVGLRIGALGRRELVPGWYVYVGSALGPGGVRARVARHLRGTRNPHWHLDYLRPSVKIVEVWFVHDRRRREHDWARALKEAGECVGAVPAFGASDCRCGSHLLRFRKRPTRDVLSVASGIADSPSGAGPDPEVWAPDRSPGGERAG